MRSILVILLIVLIAAAVLYILPKKTQAPSNTANPNVVDYETCAEAGYPVIMSNPPTCTTPDNKTFTGSKIENADVMIDQPQFGALVTSPMTIKGKALNTWFFEDNLPIRLKDDQGNVLAQKGYMSGQDWTKPGYLEINTTLTFPTPASTYGVLLIHNDNPSGLPQNDKEFSIPVRFK